MKKILTVLALIAFNVDAKPLFESGFQALEDGTPYIYQLSTNHSKQCAGDWLEAKAVYLDSGKEFMTLCWAANEYHGWNLYVPDTGEIYDSVQCLRPCKGRECEVTPDKQNNAIAEPCLNLEEFVQKYRAE